MREETIKMMNTNFLLYFITSSCVIIYSIITKDIVFAILGTGGFIYAEIKNQSANLFTELNKLQKKNDKE